MVLPTTAAFDFGTARSNFIEIEAPTAFDNDDNDGGDGSFGCDEPTQTVTCDVDLESHGIIGFFESDVDGFLDDDFLNDHCGEEGNRFCFHVLVPDCIFYLLDTVANHFEESVGSAMTTQGIGEAEFTEVIGAKKGKETKCTPPPGEEDEPLTADKSDRNREGLADNSSEALLVPLAQDLDEDSTSRDAIAEVCLRHYARTYHADFDRCLARRDKCQL